MPAEPRPAAPRASLPTWAWAPGFAAVGVAVHPPSPPAGARRGAHRLRGRATSTLPRPPVPESFARVVAGRSGTHLADDVALPDRFLAALPLPT